MDLRRTIPSTLPLPPEQPYTRYAELERGRNPQCRLHAAGAETQPPAADGTDHI